MKHTTYSDLRKNLASYMDQVNESHEPLLVTRSGTTPVVIMSLDDFSNKIDQERLHAAICQGLAEADAGLCIPAEEVFAEIGIKYPQAN